MVASIKKKVFAFLRGERKFDKKLLKFYSNPYSFVSHGSFLSVVFFGSYILIKKNRVTFFLILILSTILYIFVYVINDSNFYKIPNLLHF